ncbi:MAG: hypothetical protein ACI381_03245 [Candidatus Methanomethylophilaceae archaeon]
MSERSGLISLDKGKRRRKVEDATSEEIEYALKAQGMTTDPPISTVRYDPIPSMVKEQGGKIDELAKRLMETDSTMAVVSQRHETDMASMGERLNGLYRNLKDMEQVVTGQRTETDRRLDGLTDMIEQVEILRDKVRSQEAIITELEGKVAKLETDVGETFAEAGRMIRDVKDESTQKVEEIAKEMETRLMVRSQEETDEKLKEATRIQNKDITVMKQKMENVFSRMKRVEEDPTLKAIRLEAEQTRRDARAMMWVSAGSLITSMAVALVMVFRLAGGF